MNFVVETGVNRNTLRACRTPAENERPALTAQAYARGPAADFKPTTGFSAPLRTVSPVNLKRQENL
jgi:hypothetical protein